MNSHSANALQAGSIRCLNDPKGCYRWLTEIQGPPLFSCTLASTDTADIAAISAAGATPALRRFTPALDAEVLVHGAPCSQDAIPVNPAGPPSPVVITQAALTLLGVPPLIIDAGCRIPPQTPRLDLGGLPGRCITSGQALEYRPSFFDNCRQTGRWLSDQRRWLILAETVPGGTTTALALLQALGIDARGKVSSSIPGGNHDLKQATVDRALKAAALPADADAMACARAVGDPMQPAVALMALEASLHVPVLLGGGTQMVAVAALAQRLVQEGHPGDLTRIALATTRWVAEDPHADIGALLGALPVEMPAFSAELDFSPLKNINLRRYEAGLVKEGVGAGAAAFAALIGGIPPQDLLTEIEAVTQRLSSPSCLSQPFDYNQLNTI